MAEIRLIRGYGSMVSAEDYVALERQLAEARAEWADMLHEKNLMAAERNKCAERPRAVKGILERREALLRRAREAIATNARVYHDNTDAALLAEIDRALGVADRQPTHEQIQDTMRRVNPPVWPDDGVADRQVHPDTQPPRCERCRDWSRPCAACMRRGYGVADSPPEEPR